MPAQPSVDVSQWITAARGGSAEALGQALEAFRNYLLLVANEEMASDLQPKGGASDLVQETFLRAHREFAQFRGQSAEDLVAWLRAILLNLAANFRRSHRGTKKRRLAREVSLDGDGSNDDLKEQLIDDTPTPAGHAIRLEQLQSLQQALEWLPEHYRQVLRWRHHDNLPFEEIGRLLDRSPDAARMLWWRAIELLQQKLDSPS
jgi:RNA polymerase sigma-70 factor (ECF subfamily)